MERDLKGEIVTVKNLVGRAVALGTAAALVTAAPAAAATAEQPEPNERTTQSAQPTTEPAEGSGQSDSANGSGETTDASDSGDTASDGTSGANEGSTGDSGSDASGDGSNDSSGEDSGNSGDQADESPGAGEIDEYYQNLGAAERERLGEPVGEEQVVSDSIRYQEYANARIYWSADQGVHSVSGAVLEAFVQAGGHEALGVPATGRKTDEAGTPYGEFVGSDGTSAIYAPEGGTAHVLGGPVLRKWRSTGGGNGPLGYAVTDRTATEDGRGQYNDFANNAAIYWTAETGAHVVRGPILRKWRALGAEKGSLGYPTTDESTVADGQGSYNEFDGSGGGAVYLAPGSDEAFAVYGGIYAKWQALGGATGVLGYPTSDEQNTSDDQGRYNEFAGGDGGGAGVYWFEGGQEAFAVYGAIHDKWLATGGIGGPMGYPLSDELPGFGDEGGRFNIFTGTIEENHPAVITWTQPTKAHTVRGKIAEKYLSPEYGGPGSFLGYPTTDQRTTPNGEAVYNHFSGAGDSSIYYVKGASEAHAIYGGIRDKWQQLDWERSFLGFPVSDEEPTSDGNRRVRFQGGEIVYNPNTGEIVARPLD
ncbi:LGFP repeat-containing protein [Actinopolyspora alba]|uniref:LGFP repeat-containing protein n=1 Tax=Actinopolyspora alba TaxID=673379 RepID=A0A1I1VW52_9ACTN|nr:hypothetical protein [Actinopolyspora alba]SFD86318.1 LGFP repeat-containing protein [Actinopolyspora alba]